MNWDSKVIKQQSRQAIFKKGLKSWISLLIICFIFSFIGSANSTATDFINTLDNKLKLAPEKAQYNVYLLKKYFVAEQTLEESHSITTSIIESIIDSTSKNLTWLVNLLAANSAYFKRNASEVVAYLLLAAIVSILFRFFIQNVVVIGKNRFVMEHRFQKTTLFRRALVPFHLEHLFNVVWVTLCYHLCIMVWSITVIGGFYKHYQYRMIPFLLAENPSITRKEAFRLANEMTKGYKWNMFCLDLSLWYIWLLSLVPVAGLFISAPYGTVLETEVYFYLRSILKKQSDDSSFFCETTFDEQAWWEKSDRAKKQLPAFLLKDIVIEVPQDIASRLNYNFTDLILIFFTTSFIGWLWEVGMHLVQYHKLVKRGTMYGPWLPIYGTGAVLCILLLSRFKKSVLKTFLLIMALAGFLEFFTSWFLDFFYNSYYWEYHDMFANLNGRICLTGLLIFGIGGSIIIYVGGPYMQNKFNKLSKKQRTMLCFILCLLFITDFLCCLHFGFNSGAGVGNRYQ